MKDKTVAAMLALFLGGLGIHKFYLGKIWSGIIRLLFCWTFIPAILAFFEAIVYLATPQDSWDRRWNPGKVTPAHA